MPVLEAMAHGVPVITSNTSAMPEVAGDAALLIDPRDTEAIADALLQLTDDDRREDLIRRGVVRAPPVHLGIRRRENLGDLP